MAKTIHIATRTFETEQCVRQTLHYELTVETVEFENQFMQVYGVGIKSDAGHCHHIPSITPSQARIKQLLDCLVHFQASPITLRDIVDDWLLQ